jgi:hypothetical protein
MADDHIPFLCFERAAAVRQIYWVKRSYLVSGYKIYLGEPTANSHSNGNKCKLDHSAARIVKQAL